MNKENVIAMHIGILFGHKNDEILSFKSWTEVEIIKLSEIKQEQGAKYLAK